MPRLLSPVLFACLTAAGIAAAAAGQSTSPQTPAGGPVSTLSAGTQLVVLDVVVEDKNGNPVHDLKETDFQIEEDKAPQAIRSFDEHNDAVQARMPPGTFTDYTPVAPNGTLNVLLLDTLNTVTHDQGYVRAQLLKYIQQVSVPAKGESFLRIAVHDIPSGRFGVVEVPTSVVAVLPPAPATPGGQ